MVANPHITKICYGRREMPKERKKEGGAHAKGILRHWTLGLP